MIQLTQIQITVLSSNLYGFTTVYTEC